MGMVVRTNTMAINAQRQLNMNNNRVSKSLEKLSSGYRINRAGDDAAGLAISEKMKAQIKGLETASLNAQDGISLVQTAEGNLVEVHNMLNRMVELATRAANGTFSDENRKTLQDEVNQLNEEIDRISQSANFNGMKLLDGSMGGGAAGKAAGAVEITVDKGADPDDVAAVKGKYTTSTISALATGSGSYTFTFADGSTTTVNLTANVTDGKIIGGSGKEYATTKAGTAPTAAETATALIAELKNALGEQFTISGDNTGIILEAKTAGTATPALTGIQANINGTSSIITSAQTTEAKDAYQTWTPADGDEFTIDGKKFAIQTNADKVGDYDSDVTVIRSADVADVLAEINQVTGLNLKKDAATAGSIALVSGGGKAGAAGGLVLQIGDTDEDYQQLNVSINDMSAKSLGVASVDISSLKGAQGAIDTIRTAIDTVSAERAKLGAIQNRLDYTINNLDTTVENLNASNSRIRDTDMAKEMMEYTKMNVLVQSAQAMLAQANQQPQSVLQLLQ